MTWLKGNSFQRYTALSDLLLEHTDAGLFSTPITNGELWFSGNGHYLYDLVGNKTTLIQAAKVRYTSRDPSITLFGFYDGTTPQLQLVHLSDGRLRVTRGSTPTILATSTNVTWSLGVKVSIQWKATIGAAGSFYVKFNNQDVTWDIGSGNTNIDTRGTANSYANRVYVGPTPGVTNCYISDYWMCDSLGTRNNDFLGDLTIIARPPNANGATSSWTNSAGNSTNNFSYVDESPPTADADYVETATVDAIDTYIHQPLPSTSGTILAITLFKYAKKTDAGACNMAPVVRYAGTDSPGTSVALVENYNYEKEVFEINPVGSAPFTVSSFNSGSYQFGHKRL